MWTLLRFVVMILFHPTVLLQTEMEFLLLKQAGVLEICVLPHRDRWK